MYRNNDFDRLDLLDWITMSLSFLCEHTQTKRPTGFEEEQLDYNVLVTQAVRSKTWNSDIDGAISVLCSESDLCKHSAMGLCVGSLMR